MCVLPVTGVHIVDVLGQRAQEVEASLSIMRMTTGMINRALLSQSGTPCAIQQVHSIRPRLRLILDPNLTRRYHAQAPKP